MGGKPQDCLITWYEFCLNFSEDGTSWKSGPKVERTFYNYTKMHQRIGEEISRCGLVKKPIYTEVELHLKLCLTKCGKGNGLIEVTDKITVERFVKAIKACSDDLGRAAMYFLFEEIKLMSKRRGGEVLEDKVSWWFKHYKPNKSIY
jgi:hypothetical protein